MGKIIKLLYTETIERCQQHIDEEKPIGPTITVVTPLPIEISISAVMKLEDGYTLDNVKESFLESINTYFRDIRGEIIYTKVMGILINTTGVHDLSNLLINGRTDNKLLMKIKIPSVTTVNFSEVENQ